MAEGEITAPPLGAEDVERLLALVDERLRQRGLSRSDGEHAPALPPSFAIPQAPAPAAQILAIPQTLDRLAAPLFDTHVGGPGARLARRLLNLPLRLLATPQGYFNATVRELARAWGDLLRSLTDFEAILRIELVAQRDRLDQLAREQSRLADALSAAGVTAEDAATLRNLPLRAEVRGSTHDGRDVELTIGAIPTPGTDVVARLDALPLRPASVRSLTIAGPLEAIPDGLIRRPLAPHWRAVLAPGGTLRLILIDWPAVLEQLRTGHLGDELVLALVFGPDGTGRTSRSATALLELLRSADLTPEEEPTRTTMPSGVPVFEILAHHRRP